jgi:hypothetical protein
LVCTELDQLKHRWFDVGFALGIPRYKLRKFEGSEHPFSSMIDYWVGGGCGEGVSVSWRAVVKALETDLIRENQLAKTIQAKYCLEGEECLL